MKQKNFLRLIFFTLLISNISFGQDILTFEFSGLTGSETTANSTTNNANLAVSSISRGAGLTASNNGGRFNATSWNTGAITDAISGNDYMEFTITPNATFQFTVSSITVNVQRSGSGPGAISLRSSVDGYTSNLDAEKPIVDNTSTQSFTFTFTQANSTSGVTYRLYLHNAESTGGSGGFEGSGNDIVVNGAVTVATTDTVVEFVNTTSTVSEDGTSIDVCVAIVNEDATNATVVEVALGSSTSTNGSDYTAITYPQTLTFPAGDNTNQCITFTLTNDSDEEGDETVVINLQNVSGGSSASLGTKTTHTLTISDDDGPNVEDFSNSNATGSYGDNNFVGNNGITWSFIASRDESSYGNGSKALMLRRVADGSKVTSSTITGGIQNFSVKLYKGFTGAGTRQVELFINGVSKGTSTGFDNTSENLFTVNNINIEGDVVIELRNTQSGQIIIDDITFNSFSPATITWDGSESSDWSDGDNWSSGAVPTAGDNVIIAEVATAPSITTSIDANVNNITITDTDGLSIIGGTLTIINNLTINTGSSLYLESSVPSINTLDAATVILKGTYTSADANKFFYFTETYHNNTTGTTDGWSIVSSPTVGEKIDGNTGDGNFAFFNGLQQSATNYGIAIYDNTQTDSNLRWNYYSKGEINVATGSAVIDMENGKAYSILPNATPTADQEKGNLGFKGAIATINVGYEIKDSSPDNGGTGNAFNAIGNPYPSFLPFNATADGTNNLLTVNTGVLDEETLWIWDKATTDYITVNQTTTVGADKNNNERTSLYIAPAQGFFVKAKSMIAPSDFNFTEAMQSHQTSGIFNRTENTRPEIKLSLTSNNVTKNTFIYYYDGKTTGFDNGYDSSIFGGLGTSFGINTQLVSANEGKSLAIQSLPKDNYEAMIIPIGVNAKAGKEIIFSANALNLPTNINVYLEDRELNIFTRLDVANSTYKLTLTNDLSDIGRFYLYTTESTLGVKNTVLNNISIYKKGPSTIRVAGLQQGRTTFSLYSILGKQVYNSSFETNGVKDVSLPKLGTGVYFVKVKTETGEISKKIILE